MADKLQIQNMIYEIRGQKVMIDSDLARLYDVPTHRLNESVKRNADRFPPDFMFQLSEVEWENLLISQFAISKSNRGGRRFMPYAFTEQGVAMLASVLSSPKAVAININIMRAFVELRHYVLLQSKDGQIDELRKLLMLHIENTDHKLSKHDSTIEQIIIALNNLIAQPPKTKKIGFRTEE